MLLISYNAFIFNVHTTRSGLRRRTRNAILQGFSQIYVLGVMTLYTSKAKLGDAVRLVFYTFTAILKQRIESF